MNELKLLGGDHISKAAEQLIGLVKTDGDSFMIFNGICLPANQFSTIASICDDYDRLSELSRKEYEASSEGIARKQESESERKRLQETADNLMGELPDIDFNDVAKVLDWFCAIEPSRDRIGVSVDNATIINTLESHGYLPNMCCGDEFDENDRTTFAKWLIGQALGPVPMTRHFTEQWKERFKGEQK